jgi:hypothetical protein
MGHRSIPGFCERCGQRFELTRAEPGERDLGLDRIQASFRYCVSCQLFVGRTCCWNPDAVACIVDAPSFALTTAPAPGALIDGRSNERLAHRGLTELAASLDAVEHVDDLVGYAPQTDEDRETGRKAWDDAWWAMGWLIARAESSRDAAAKALRRVSAQPDGSEEDMAGRLSSLVESYGRARAMIEARLVAVGRSLRRRDRRRLSLAPWGRLEPAMIGIGALAAVGVLAFGSAALLQLGYLNPFALNRGAIASHPDEAVLGGAGVPGQSKSATATPAEPAAVVARLNFDELYIGPLAGASDEIRPVAGDPEVVAFPSSFDRSIAFVGDVSHRFCLPIATLDDERIWFDMDLYAKTPVVSGRLRLSMAPLGAAATAASVPLELLDDLRLQAWHHLRVVLTPRQPVTIEIGEAASGQMQTRTLAPNRHASAVAGGVCAAVSGMAEEAVLLLDDLRVEQ